jgi:Dehydrogenases with different specificities (related to short-chain alcohol dehydrogenases)
MEKHVIVIGGTRGSGKAFAVMAAERGERVSVIGRRKISGLELGHEAITTYSLDITDQAALADAIPRICRETPWTSLVFFQKYRADGDDWAGEQRVSLDATKAIVELCVEAIPETAPPQDRAIVVIGSVAGKTIIADQPIGYHAAKAALEHMVRYWAVHLGPRGIRVNMVSPHAVLKEESADFYLGYTKLMDLYKKIIPLGRMGTSREIASVVHFLTSEGAAYVTGQNLAVDGGICLQMLEGPIRAALHMER